MHCFNELCYILIISISNFHIFIHFTYQKTLKPSLAQKLKLIFKFSKIMGQINIPLRTHMEHKGWRKDGKTFIRWYTIALKLWDEFNANFALLYFSSYSTIKMWDFFLKNVEKNNNAVHLRLVLTCLFLKLFNTKKHLVLPPQVTQFSEGPNPPIFNKGGGSNYDEPQWCHGFCVERYYFMFVRF